MVSNDCVGAVHWMVGGFAVAGTTIGFQFGSEGFPAQIAVETIDLALVHRLRAGEEAAYELLLNQFEKPVYSLVARLTDSSSDAADIVQEVFLKVFRNISSFRGDSSLKTWIYRIAVNETRNQRRWFGRHRRQEVQLDPGPEEARGTLDYLTDPGNTPYEQTLQHEAQALLEAALAEVNPNFRTALILREVEDLSYEEISEILQISLGTVKSRIMRGREDLRARFERIRDRQQIKAGVWRGKELLAR